MTNLALDQVRDGGGAPMPPDFTARNLADLLLAAQRTHDIGHLDRLRRDALGKGLDPRLGYVAITPTHAKKTNVAGRTGSIIAGPLSIVITT